MLVISTLSVNDRTVRLACVRHAASVRPEPGSNPQIKYLSVNLFLQRLTLAFFRYPFDFSNGLNYSKYAFRIY